MGRQSDDSLSFITEESTINFHQNIIEEDHQNQLGCIFNKTSKGLLELLEGLLTYNPCFRMTIAESLNLPIFN